MDIINALESNVRSYCRTWPTVFERSQGSYLYDVDGREYIDFFAGAGVLNYGHNHPKLKRALIEYLEQDGIVHGLDMATVAKETLLQTFDDIVLKPRGLDYKVQFPGPTGTNAVEAALKLARKITGRETIISFTNAFHGMTLGSLAVTGNEMKRRGAGVPLGNSVSMPYEDFLGEDVDTISYLDAHLAGGSSGVDIPAAVIVETVQAEGGIHTASMEWLQSLADLCERYEVLLIIDDIQAGCGRTGRFFSFEDAGLKPDIVCLSKSLSGFGLPMALTLFKPEHDQWDPGEHNGTFRGNNAAFVTATETLKTYWTDNSLTSEVERKGKKVETALREAAALLPEDLVQVRGRGLIRGLYVDIPGFADDVAKASFEQGLVHETSGPDSEVIKILPPLTIEDELLERGLALIKNSVAEVVRARAETEPALAGTSS